MLVLAGTEVCNYLSVFYPDCALEVESSTFVLMAIG